MSRTVVCPNCQSPQAVSESETSPEQNQDQGEIRCAQCGYPFTLGPEAAAPQTAKILWIDDEALSPRAHHQHYRIDPEPKTRPAEAVSPRAEGRESP
jgi:uncharacterized Zn finger protein (UPF0148 family)